MRRFTFVLLMALLSCNQTDTSSFGGSAGALQVVTSSSLPTAYNNEAYREEIRITGGQRVYTLRLAKGRLPEGMRFEQSTLIGTPKVTFKQNENQGQLYEFTVEISDARLATKVQDFKLTVRDLPAPEISWKAPQGNVRDEIKIPFEIKTPKNVRSFRVAVPLPDGARLKSLESGAGKPLLLSKLVGKVLRIDGALSEPILSVRTATVFYMTLTLTKPVAVIGTVGFELRSASNVLSRKTLDLKPVTPTQPNQPNQPAQPTQPQPGQPQPAQPTNPPGNTPPTTPPGEEPGDEP
jgi:Putative Ig domain